MRFFYYLLGVFSVLRMHAMDLSASETNETYYTEHECREKIFDLMNSKFYFTKSDLESYMVIMTQIEELSRGVISRS